jgi:hypothetical protein
MPRIRTDQPSSGRPQNINWWVGGSLETPPAALLTDWRDIAEADDFSIPSTGAGGVTLDPADSSRELRPGELYFETPLHVANNSANSCWVQLEIIQQGGNSVAGLQSFKFAQVIVPANETVMLPIQGLRLLKTNLAALRGDRLRARAQTAGVLQVWGSAVSLEFQDHAPDSEAP